MKFRQQKAPSESIKLDQIIYPMLGSYKLDGIRCTIVEGLPKSTTNTLLPSGFAKLHFGRSIYEGFDGELLTASPTPGRIYNEAMSAVMTQGGREPLHFHVFDVICDLPYRERLEELEVQLGLHPNPYIKVLEQRLIVNEESLLAFEEEALALGHEGIMLRTAIGRYKMGRTTLREYNIFKFVRHMSAEAEVIGIYEQMENTNEKVEAATGLSKRSTHKAGKVGKGTLGGFNCRNLSDGVEFNMGTGIGLDIATRQRIFDHPEDYIGRIARYKCKPYGKKDKPRQPIWDGWRAKEDMSNDDEVGDAF